MLIMIWTTSIFSFWADTQRVAYKYKTLVIITLMVSIAKPLLGIILVIKANDKVTARILGLVLVEVLGYSPLLFIQLKKEESSTLTILGLTRYRLIYLWFLIICHKWF